MIIVGAGMAGLLAANMLRNLSPVIVERQPELPHNHSAVLRFRSNVVGDVLNIPFRRVSLVKAVQPWRNPVADALAYSRKCLGLYLSDRSPTLSARVETVERFIAPSNLIERMAARADITYNAPYDFDKSEEKVVSTIPMPHLMDALHYQPAIPINFRWRQGINIRAVLKNCDAFASITVPDPDLIYSRVSITANELIVECPGEFGNEEIEANMPALLEQATELLGLDADDIETFEWRRQAFSKIAPIEESARRRFIHWASSVTGKAWQVGRFAIWKPGLLLDDLVGDIRLVSGWMTSETPDYDAEMHQHRRR